MQLYKQNPLEIFFIFTILIPKLPVYIGFNRPYYRREANGGPNFIRVCLCVCLFVC